MPFLKPVSTSRLALLMGLGVSVPALADDSFLTEDDLFSDVPLVQSVTGLKQQLSETPAATTIIDQELIKTSGAVNIADLLRLVPGFQVYHVNANKFAVVSHGQAEKHPGRLEVMIDGRSVYLPLQSTVDWSTLGITLDDIDYIEIVRGSNVPTQGSNAFLGSINIVTKEPFKHEKRRVKLVAGSEHWLQSQFQTSGQLGDVDYGLSGDILHNHGFGLVTEGINVYELDDGADIAQLNFRGVYTPSLMDSFDFSFGLSRGGIAVGESHNPELYGDRDVTSHYQSVRWNRILDSATELQVHAYHNYLKYDHTLTEDISSNFLSALIGGDPHPAFVLDRGIEDGTSQRFDANFSMTQEVDSKNRWIWGAGVRHELVKSKILFGNDPIQVDETFYRAFANLEHRFNPLWVLNAGAMIESNNISSTKISPRVGVNYKIHEGHVFRGIASQAYRTPSLLQANERTTVAFPDDPSFGTHAGQSINLVSRPNENLKPEKVNSFELGYSWFSSQSRSNLDLRLYYEQVKDAIDAINVDSDGDPEELLSPLPGKDETVREYRNNAFWTTRGLDIQLGLQATEGDWLHVAYGYAHANGDYPQETADPNDIFSAIRFVPKHTLAAVWSHKVNSSNNLSFSWYTMSRQELHGTDPTPSYTRLDMRYAHGFDIQGSGSKGEIEFIVHNLFDEYTEFDTNNIIEPKAFIRLTLDF